MSDDLASLLKELVAAAQQFAPADMVARTRQRAPQFEEFVKAQNDLIQSGACLLTGSSSNEDYAQYLRLVSHAEGLWDSACTLFRAKSFAHSLFFAISCVEETGKIGVTRFQMILRGVSRQKTLNTAAVRNVKRHGNPFYSHPQKHLLAAGAGAIVNSRLEKVVGHEAVSNFLDAVRTGEVERLRQSALYADLGENGPVLPAEQIGREQAAFYVVLAGELLADVLGATPSEWERLLAKVDAFEREMGYST